MNRKTAIIAALLIAFIFMIFASFSVLPAILFKPKQTFTPDAIGARPTIEKPHKVTMEGITVCLAHKDTTGPQTEECAFGFRSNKGEYYILDRNLISSTSPEFKTGERIKASGTYTPIEYLSTNMWDKYDVKGVFSVTDSFKVIK